MYDNLITQSSCSSKLKQDRCCSKVNKANFCFVLFDCCFTICSFQISANVLLCKQNHNHLISCLIDNNNILLIETDMFTQYHVIIHVQYIVWLRLVSILRGWLKFLDYMNASLILLTSSLFMIECMYMYGYTSNIDMSLNTSCTSFSYFLSWLMMALQNSGRSFGRRDVIKLPSTTTGESSYSPLKD